MPVRVNNQIIYPVGKFEGLWTNIELNYALELGYKINVLSAYLYDDKVDNLFTDYVNEAAGAARSLYLKVLNVI